VCRMARWALLAALLLSAGTLCFPLPAPSEEAPAAAPTTKEPTELRLPPDLIYEGGSEGGGAVIFRHTTHAAFAGNNCLACHPALFKILHPERRTSHDEMGAGKACGACHDGKKAFGATDTESCPTCHSGGTGREPEGAKAAAAGASSAPGGEKPAPAAAGAPAPRSGPKDVKLAKNDGSPGTVTFRHSSHAGANARCARCHPGLFPMKAGDKPLDYEAMLKGATCGACHNGKEAFAVDDSDRCDKCHAPEEGSR
jgi:c(7)-type cytochrome triheme protein